MLANQSSKIARTAELKIAIEQICIEIMNLRMWNIKSDKNLKAKDKLHKHHVAHILKKQNRAIHKGGTQQEDQLFLLYVL